MKQYAIATTISLQYEFHKLIFIYKKLQQDCNENFYGTNIRPRVFLQHHKRLFFFFSSLQEVFIATTLSLLLQSILVKQTIFHMVFISSSLSSCLSSLEPEF